MTGLALHKPDEEFDPYDPTERDPALTASDQTSEAEGAMDRPLEHYLHLPFEDVNGLVGAIPPGDVGFVAAFSGQGKTTLMASMIAEWIEEGKCVYVLPLESEPKVFRTHLACKKLGYHAGMLITGEYKRTKPRVEFIEIHDAVRAELKHQVMSGMAEKLFVSPTVRMDTQALRKAAEHAAKLEADVFIVDHIDHVSADGKSGHAESVAVVDTLLDVTREMELHTIATSQLNHEGLRGDRLGQYRCPQPQHLYMGGKKRQIAAWMLGLFRPFRFSGVPKDEMAAAKAGRTEAWKILEPKCMGVGLMKSRHFGEREGRRVYLSVENGCVTELDQQLRAFLVDGVRTGSLV